jgi:hypothetical protein
MIRLEDEPDVSLDYARLLKYLPPSCDEENPVGLIANNNALEYPLWIGAPIFAGRPIRFEFVPPNQSKAASFCAVVDISKAFPDNATMIPAS